MQLNVFKSDAFTEIELTASINLLDYVPSFLGSLGMFRIRPTNLTSVFIEQRGDKLVLVPNTPRGGVPKPLQHTTSTQKRKGRSFDLYHLPQEDFLPADEIQGVRAFGSQSDLELAMGKVQEKQEGMRRNIELTWENLMLGAVKGVIYDADGSTVLHDLFDEFDVIQETEVDFDLDNATPASGAVLAKCDDVTRLITKNLLGVNPATRIIGLCGDTFWNQLVAHAEVRATWLNWTAAQNLRQGTAFRTMSYGGIEWFNYRGTNDGTTVAVSATKAHIFPVGVPGLWDMYFGPANKNSFVNTLGIPFYSFLYVDQEDRGVKVEAQSNPLPICTQPKVLIKAKNT